VKRLACSATGAAALRGTTVVFFDGGGGRVGEQKLDFAPVGIHRFGDEWLALVPKQKHLRRVGADTKTSPFAAGKGIVGACAVGRDDAVALARGEVVELWSRDEERTWSAKGAAPVQAVAIGRDHVVALGEDAALYFFSREKGEALGALRLASTESPTSWRLAHVDGVVVVLALGEWLVWIDASTRKPLRRVRARAKILDVSADAEHVVIAVDDGGVQVFRSKSGDPRASLDGERVDEVALGSSTLFTLNAVDAEPDVRARERQALDVSVRSASPVNCIATRGSVAAVGDRTGKIRVFETASGAMREVGLAQAGEGTIGLFVSTNDSVVTASARVVMRSGFSYDANITGVRKTPAAPLRPIALKTPPTAFAADDTYAFVGTQAGAVDVYELGAGRQLTTYALSSDDRITALLRLSGATLVVGTGALDGRVLVVDVAEAKVVHRISPHDEAFGITCLAADARGRIVASGSDEGSVALIDPVKGRVLAKLRVSETPTSLAFEPAGRRLACVFADGTAAVASFAQKATMVDLGLRGVTQVSWADGLVFGFNDGRVESGDRHVRPSERPAAGRP
jgi:hypothetical protein